jgi:Icc-related predicted phosphoesterase
VIRVAAVGDIHVGVDTSGAWAERFRGLAAEADLLLLAGDLTKNGRPEEADCVVRELEAVGVPTVAVLGNHDHHSSEVEGVVSALERGGIRVLEGESVVFPIRGQRVGVAGSKGFGGGFLGSCGSEFGEPEMKAFVGTTRRLAEGLRLALSRLEADLKLALLHYAPVADTLEGERREIYPFLGSYLLAEAIDGAGADLVLHGHAHAGVEVGETAGGVPVRNVAQPVIRRAYRLYCFAREEAEARYPVSDAARTRSFATAPTPLEETA